MEFWREREGGDRAFWIGVKKFMLPVLGNGNKGYVLETPIIFTGINFTVSSEN